MEKAAKLKYATISTPVSDVLPFSLTELSLKNATVLNVIFSFLQLFLMLFLHFCNYFFAPIIIP